MDPQQARGNQHPTPDDTMLTTAEVNGIRELLNSLNNEDVVAIAKTTKRHKTVIETLNEAVTRIVENIKNAQDFLLRKKVKKSILSNYLKNKGQDDLKNVTKAILTDQCLRFWRSNDAVEPDHQSKTQSPTPNVASSPVEAFAPKADPKKQSSKGAQSASKRKGSTQKRFSKYQKITGPEDLSQPPTSGWHRQLRNQGPDDVPDLSQPSRSELQRQPTRNQGPDNIKNLTKYQVFKNTCSKKVLAYLHAGVMDGTVQIQGRCPSTKYTRRIPSLDDSRNSPNDAIIGMFTLQMQEFLGYEDVILLINDVCLRRKAERYDIQHYDAD